MRRIPWFVEADVLRKYYSILLKLFYQRLIQFGVLSTRTNTAAKVYPMRRHILASR